MFFEYNNLLGSWILYYVENIELEFDKYLSVKKYIQDKNEILKIFLATFEHTRCERTEKKSKDDNCVKSVREKKIISPKFILI